MMKKYYQIKRNHIIHHSHKCVIILSLFHAFVISGNMTMITIIIFVILLELLGIDVNDGERSEKGEAISRAIL